MPSVVESATAVESLLRRDRWLVLSAIVVAIGLCWAWIVPMAIDMYGMMEGPAAWMMTMTWDLPHLVLLFAMWTVMMIGMMLPSAAPAILLYGNVVRKSSAASRTASHLYVFTGGYLAAWTAFSLIATVIQRLLSGLLLVSPMMKSRDPIFGGLLLILAGVYQFSPLKYACLRSCRSPAEFLSRYWQSGLGGGFRLGFRHGLYCLGCCWALMMLLFVGGVMNLWWIAALTIFVLIEKIAPLGRAGGRITGILLFASGVGMVAKFLLGS